MLYLLLDLTAFFINNHILEKEMQLKGTLLFHNFLIELKPIHT